MEDTNVKLGDVVSDIMGKASRRILYAIADGETDPSRLAAFAIGRVRASQEQLEAALTGRVTDHHRFLLREHLTQIRHLELAIDRVTAEITRRFTPPSPPEETTALEKEDEATQERASESTPLPEAPVPPQAALSWTQAVVLLRSIPGISERPPIGTLPATATAIKQFPTAAHLASWPGVCPANH